MNQNQMGNNYSNPNNTQNPYAQNYPQQPGIPNQNYPASPQQRIPQSGLPMQNGNSTPFPGQMTPGKGYPGNSNGKKPAKKKKKGNAKWVFLGIFFMLALIIGGGYLGYQTAISARVGEYNRRARMAASEQYQMALSDMAEGKMENAKTRLEYVLRVDPNFSGATEKYQEVVVALFPKATPTPAMTSTPQPTPTVDLRGEEEMYQGVVNAMYAQDWQSAMDQMDALRDKNLAYKGLEVDGMYYVALRNIGMQLINQGYLESGVYKITLAGSFGPIDAAADNLRTAARSYLAGAGFWEIDWNKALDYYSNAYISFPNMFDQATRLSAQQRYIDASFEVGNLYVISQDYCNAIPYYQQGLSISANESQAATATAVYLVCYPPTEVPVSMGEGLPGEVLPEEPLQEDLPQPVVEETY